MMIDPSSLGTSEEGEAAAHPASPLRFLSLDHDGPLWIAKAVEVTPGQVDGEIIYVTPAMDCLYGYRWPDTLLGQRIAEIHLGEDAQITRQYAVLRCVGYAMPQHYVMHARHPNGRIFRVVKHVGPYHPGPPITWVTHHERWQHSTSYPSLVPPQMPPWLHQVMAHLSVQRAPAPPELGASLPLGTRLRQARQAHGLSQQALAQRCTAMLGRGVTPQHLSNLEHGHRLPSLPLLQVLATVLPLDPIALVAAASRPVGRPETPTGSAPRGAPEDLLARVQQAAQQAAQVHQGYREALVAAQQAGYSLRQLATAVGLSPSRIRQLVTPSPSVPASPTSVM